MELRRRIQEPVVEVDRTDRSSRSASARTTPSMREGGTAYDAGAAVIPKAATIRAVCRSGEIAALWPHHDPARPGAASGGSIRS